MQEGILNEPVRENAERLLETFSDQMGIRFEQLLFVVVSEDGTFRTANYSKGPGLTVEAIKLIAKHLQDWAGKYGEEGS